MSNDLNPQDAFLLTKLSHPLKDDRYTPVQSLPYYSILWIQEGRGVHHVDFEVYPFGDNTVFFLSPGQLHSIELNSPLEGVILCFKDEFFCLGEDHILKPQYDFLFNLSAKPSSFKLSSQTSDYLKIIIDKIHEEYLSPSNLRDELLRSYVKILLLKLSEILPQVDALPMTFDKSNETFFDFKRLIEKYYKTRHRVADYAKILNVTGKCLNEMVRKAAGKTATQMIHERIVLEAKRYLYHSPLSIKDLADNLGYDDPYYFSRFFSRSVGLSPQKFRDLYRKPSIRNSDSSMS